MDSRIYRCFVEKRPGFDVAALAIQTELSAVLRLNSMNVRLFNRYDIQNLAADRWQIVMNTVLSEPASDFCYEENLPSFNAGTRLICVEPLPGQFDIRADSCEQCIQMLLGGARPVVRAAVVYAIAGLSDDEFNRVKAYLINPVERREASPDKPTDLINSGGQTPGDIPVIDGFIRLNDPEIKNLRQNLGLAMSPADLVYIREYFADEHRDPTLAELYVIDTYWSDHCRHTTFNTVIDSADIRDLRVKRAYDLFLSVNGKKPVTLMNIATAAMRHLKESGGLPVLDISEENNACTLRVNADFTHGSEEWLLFFKNETHNHPTEIEPYGGAATCIGGAIRDPLSGRAYVYQSMRITGAGDPRKPIEDTLHGKLPQRKLTVTAANGFSSYGNQIGLATGYVKELYHDGYIAKRLETGAVVGAAPLSWVRRERPADGDIVVALGGRTGRDGIGGATGSSKTHGANTVSECASEVQKGNAPEERKLQRLFRNPNVTRLIKRCNDFGAGGVSVAIGELSGGVEINLDAFPVKYNGLNGMELAISESQERMAVVVAENDLPELLSHAESENIEISAVARITGNKRLIMKWRGAKIVDISRDFLNTNGVKRYAKVYAPPVNDTKPEPDCTDIAGRLTRLAGDLNFCSQKGLVERFDNSIGAASVFMPHGGRRFLTETQIMAALMPMTGARTASVMSYGFDPFFTEADPFGGSVYAVVTSVAKLVASGVALDTIHLSLQEFFPSVKDDAVRWGLPFSAALGAFFAQMGLKIAAIGGKDSMSGTFEELDVPPTLISFAIGLGNAADLISPEFKRESSPVYLLETPAGQDGLPDYAALRTVWKKYSELCLAGKVLAAWSCEKGGVYGGIFKMALGSMIGFSGVADAGLFDNHWGSIIFEAAEKLDGYKLLGYTQSSPTLDFSESSLSGLRDLSGTPKTESRTMLSLSLRELRDVWEAPLEEIFSTKISQSGHVPVIKDKRRPSVRSGVSVTRPKAVIPVFPGTNCEYDVAMAFERARGAAEVVMIRNLTPAMLSESIIKLEKAITSAQMIIFPGGFSGGDEPDGSGKFIVSLFRSQRLTDAVHDLLYNRDGLILGICNGFQALVKMGLLPYGRIAPMTAESPTITFNRIGRHQARYVSVSVSSMISPWLSECLQDDVYVQPVSHGEGRFIASEDILNQLREKGQIVFQYADNNGVPSMDIAFNPNGSDWAIEGICSADGRVLGKMAHPERYAENVAKNIIGNKFLPIFEGGVNYFS
ncbi:MAG: phosphoribosylformylglycinamidine synthase [Deferribacteraceae bacterium]|nr:phosphoribosylformylglycinamidine synthase [Deferribacteraceae bacterium]